MACWHLQWAAVAHTLLTLGLVWAHLLVPTNVI